MAITPSFAAEFPMPDFDTCYMRYLYTIFLANALILCIPETYTPNWMIDIQVSMKPNDIPLLQCNWIAFIIFGLSAFCAAEAFELFKSRYAQEIFVTDNLIRYICRTVYAHGAARATPYVLIITVLAQSLYRASTRPRLMIVGVLVCGTAVTHAYDWVYSELSWRWNTPKFAKDLDRHIDEIGSTEYMEQFISSEKCPLFMDESTTQPEDDELLAKVADVPTQLEGYSGNMTEIDSTECTENFISSYTLGPRGIIAMSRSKAAKHPDVGPKGTLNTTCAQPDH